MDIIRLEITACYIFSSFQVARSGTELSIQLLGGARRLTPANSHQFPLAVVMSGPGKSGAYGLAIARHLAAQGVRTVAYVPEMSVYPSVLASELSLYKLCCKGGSNKHNILTSSLTELPKTPVDLVSGLTMTFLDLKSNWTLKSNKGRNLLSFNAFIASL